MKKKLVLCLDQGGSSSRAIVFDETGDVVDQYQQKVSEHRQGSQVEQSSDELLSSLISCATGVLRRLSDQQRAALSCCGLITQRSSLVAVNGITGEALSPVLSWQDTRGESLLPEDESSRDLIYQRTGLKPNGHFGASKMRWLLQHCSPVQRAVEQDQLLFVPLASYLNYHLFGRQQWLVDRGNGSRTLLMNLATGEWDEALLDLFGLKKEYLPELTASDSDFGEFRGGELRDGDMEVNEMSLPMRLLTGDQCAAVFSAGQLPAQQLNINIGTGAFLLTALSATGVQAGLLNSVVHWGELDGPHYCLEATVNGAGAAIDHMAAQLGVDDIRQVEQVLATEQSLPLFINTVSGLGSPDWRSDIAPFFVSDSGSSDLHRLAGVAESIVFLMMRNIQRMRRYKTIDSIMVSGGLSNSDQLCQRLSNLSGLDVTRSQNTEASARGAAYLLLGCPEHWPSLSASRFFEPLKNIALVQRFQQWTEQLENRLVAD